MDSQDSLTKTNGDTSPAKSESSMNQNLGVSQPDFAIGLSKSEGDWHNLEMITVADWSFWLGVGVV